MKRYVLHTNEKDLVAIFDNNTQQQISQWWNEIKDDGLLEGRSDYYLVKDNNRKDDRKYAIFHKDNPNTPVSQWWNYIDCYHLLKGSSQYYIATNSNSQKAIFHINNPEQPVSSWVEKITHHTIEKGTLT